MWRQLFLSSLVIVATVSAMTVSTYAAFTSSATISGMNFSTGQAALKLFGNLGYTNAGNNGNLTTSLPGRGFEGIGPNWTHDYLLKYFNTGSVNLITSLKLVVTSDPGLLADQIKVEVWLWNDLDGNGQTGGSDTYQQLSPPQPMTQLVSNPVILGQLNPGNPRGILLRFTTDDLPTATQNMQALFNFVIEGTTAGATP